MFADQARTVVDLRDRARRHLDHRLDRATGDLVQQLSQVRALSPLATLRRGYTLLQDPAGRLVTAPAEVSAGDSLVARLATGSLHVSVTEVDHHEITEGRRAG
jgi:exodeoxyribonuclease VII large subunit